MFFTVNELKVFLNLFADEQVVFAKSPQTLQSMLNDIENYCETWWLKINTSKTKVMIFEKGIDGIVQYRKQKHGREVGGADLNQILVNSG